MNLLMLFPSTHWPYLCDGHQRVIDGNGFEQWNANRIRLITFRENTSSLLPLIVIAKDVNSHASLQR